MPIDTFNKFAVTSSYQSLTMFNPPGPGHLITKADALLLAAYLVALGGGLDEFKEVFDAVCNA